ncbi:3f43e709-2b35-4d97-bf4f-0bcc024f9389 [Sclerotinia trifoliorum]|uniref:3f43e709-2b35-4d97-bf4f-0bcc024f9389 n=1 Tax=Sclerotinia trifoliorum TaxID=28548 RepID=A0A8H2W721_9HELO|nr:3f43e709-2b35-4d97-bf4f-0bcc024f9389 [Sclerotinia trifoliorum]
MLRVNRGEIQAVAFSPDSTIIILCMNDEVQLWNTQTGQFLRRLEVGGRGRVFLALSSDKKALALRTEAGVSTDTEIWNLATGEVKEMNSVPESADDDSLVFPSLKFLLNGELLNSGRIFCLKIGHDEDGGFIKDVGTWGGESNIDEESEEEKSEEESLAEPEKESEWVSDSSDEEEEDTRSPGRMESERKPASLKEAGKKFSGGGQEDPKEQWEDTESDE